MPTQLEPEPSVIRQFLANRGSGRLADRAFSGLMVVCACSIFAIVIFILTILVLRSKLSLAQFGFKFFTSQAWDPVSGDFGALPFIYGTLATSFLALLMAVPLALGVAVFLTELCPKFLRAPISFLTELLAAIPSVVYGCGRSSCWCPSCAIIWGRFSTSTLDGRGCLKARTSAWAC
jgi:phosphate transport system permease protein